MTGLSRIIFLERGMGGRACGLMGCSSVGEALGTLGTLERGFKNRCSRVSVSGVTIGLSEKSENRKIHTCY